MIDNISINDRSLVKFDDVADEKISYLHEGIKNSPESFKNKHHSPPTNNLFTTPVLTQIGSLAYWDSDPLLPLLLRLVPTQWPLRFFQRNISLLYTAGHITRTLVPHTLSTK